MACVYFSIFPKDINLIPFEASRTMPSIVEMVITEKTIITKIKPTVLCLAAGYISIGIKGSQGPKTKIVNKTHGVILMLDLGDSIFISRNLAQFL